MTVVLLWLVPQLLLSAPQLVQNLNRHHDGWLGGWQRWQQQVRTYSEWAPCIPHMM